MGEGLVNENEYGAYLGVTEKFLEKFQLIENNKNFLGLLSNPWPGAIAFCLGIMAIIGCHEMGHKLMADRRGVGASFPYFIPAPTFLGTFGAVIRMKTRPRDRNSLFDVGAAGLIGGFLALIPVTILGLLWSFPVPAESAQGIPYLNHFYFNGWEIGCLVFQKKVIFYFILWLWPDG